ncbi:hypothetical protein EMOOHJMP_00183 [Microcystis phage MaAM05]|nr:hypothetical protein EMOOHJMP_00183 [Microcystis phage MaAM05]
MLSVIPAEAGIQFLDWRENSLKIGSPADLLLEAVDSRLRGNDKVSEESRNEEGK